MATPLSLYVDVLDLDSNQVVAVSTVLGEYKRTRSEDKAGGGTVFANAGTNVANALVTASGGPDGTGPIKSYALRISEDGGASYDYRTVIRKPQRHLQPPYGVSDQGEDYATLLTLAGEDRITWFSTPVADILTNPGTDGRPKGFLLNTLGKGNQAGAAEIAIGPVVWPQVAGVRLNVDIWADYLNNALTQVCARLGGTYIQGQTVPLGHYAHWHYDPRTNQVHVGKTPTTPHVTFTDQPLASLDDEASTAQYVADGLTPDHQLDAMYSQAEFIGGSSDHGMPSGGKVACMLQINTGRGPKSSLWDDNLQIVGISSDQGSGGVFLQPHSGALVQCSQPMDVRALAYDSKTGTLYAFTAHGVFQTSATAGNLTKKRKGKQTGPTWVQVGGLKLPCVGGSFDGGVLIAHVGGSQGTGKQASGQTADGIYRYPAAGGDTSGAQNGYSGWQRLLGGTVEAFAYRQSLDRLYAVTKDHPDFIRKYQPASTGAAAPTTIPTPGQRPITRLSQGPAGCYVVTAAGSDGLFYLPDGGALVGANSDQTLGLVAVNDVVPVAGAVLKYKADDGSIKSISPAAVALTGAGIYATKRAAGGAWVELTKNTGLAVANVTLFSVGAAQTVLGRQLLRVYAGNDSSLWSSCNEGRDYQDLLASPLDLGPFWQALADASGAGPYADNTVTALGTVSGSAGGLIGIIGGPGLPAPSGGSGSGSGGIDLGGTGVAVAIPSSLAGFGYLPNNWIWARRLDKLGQFVYRLVNLGSQAPAGGIRFEALGQITADAATPVINASENIGVVAFRWLSQASVPQTILTVQSQYHTQEAALRTLCSGDLVAFTGALTVDSSVGGVGDHAPTTLFSYTNAPFWVLEHTAEMAGPSTMFTTTRIGTRLGEQLESAQDIAAALAYKQEKHARYTTRAKAA